MSFLPKSFNFSEIEKKAAYGRAKSFIDHLEKFMLQASLAEFYRECLVALSGGMDSVALAVSFALLQKRGVIKSFSLMHVNHGVRAASQQEEEFVRYLADKMGGVNIKVKHLEGLAGQSNFEMRAREGRYQFFQECAKNSNGLIYTGHHIDDSFEWSLLHSLKSSTLTPFLGIPVKSRNIRRPFMCVSRKHIEKFVTDLGIPFTKDESNESWRFERNYLRQAVIPLLSAKYPKYLKHYCHRSNHLAQKLGKWALHTKASQKVKEFSGAANASIFINTEVKSEFFHYKEEIRQAIYRYSTCPRGKLSRQIDNLLDCSLRGGVGPILFSGGVEGHLAPAAIIIIGQQGKREYLELDKIYAAKLEAIIASDIPGAGGRYLREVSYSQLEARIMGDQADAVFPYWAIAPFHQHLSRIVKSSRRVDPLWPKTTKFLIDNDWWFQSGLFLLRYWKKRAFFSVKQVKLMPPLERLLLA